MLVKELFENFNSCHRWDITLYDININKEIYTDTDKLDTIDEGWREAEISKKRFMQSSQETILRFMHYHISVSQKLNHHYLYLNV